MTIFSHQGLIRNVVNKVTMKTIITKKVVRKKIIKKTNLFHLKNPVFPNHLLKKDNQIKIIFNFNYKQIIIIIFNNNKFFQ